MRGLSLRGAVGHAGVGIVLTLALAGCPYVSRGELEQQLELRDDDGDGVSVADGDCNDNDASVVPGGVEVPYDAIDNDCVGGDLQDLDGDGYAGCPLVAGACVTSDIEGLDASVLAAVDCNENDPNVYPGAVDAPYDGVDADCRGDHDFDQDGDGYTLAGVDDDELDAYEAAEGVSADGRGDCSDVNTTIYPGASPDAWYDGVDTDCDGAHDFDQDSDGFIAPADANGVLLPAYTRYADALGLETPPASEWDCDDLTAAVNPGAGPEVWYDGVDTDCDGAHDFDQDGDGSVTPVDADGDRWPAFDAYIADLGLPDPPASQWDCLDADDGTGVDPSLVYPGALERLGDVDYDCQGDGGNPVWSDGGLVLEGARTLRLAHDPGRFVLGLLTDVFDSPAGAPAQDGIVLLAFDDAGPAAPVFDEAVFEQQFSGVVDAALALQVTSGDLEVGTATPLSPNSRQWTIRYTGIGAGLVPPGASDSLLATSGAYLAVAMDLTDAWAFSCGDGALLAGDRLAGDPLGASVLTEAVPGDILTCFAEESPGEVTVCGSVGCRTFAPQGTALAEVVGSPRTGQAITSARRRDGVWTFIDDGMLSIEGVAGPSGSADVADAATDGTDVVALVVNADALLLRHGPVGGPFEHLVLGPPTSAPVVDVAVGLSDGRVFAAILTSDDALQWAVWAR